MRILRFCVLSLVVFGPACGGDSTPPSDAGTDASFDGGDAQTVDVVDAGSEASGLSCDPTKPFGTPALVVELNQGPQNLFARLTHDELTAYFEEYGVAPSKLWTATRASATAPFGTPTAVAGVASTTNDFDPSPTGDDLTLYFASQRTGGAGGVDIWSATRSSTTATFGSVTNLGAVNTANNEHTPYVMPDDLTLYYTGGASSIMRATRTSTTSPYAVDTSNVLNAVNVSGEVAPVVTIDELTLYYASDDANVNAPLVMMRSTRTSTTGPFGAGAAVAELAMTGNVVPDWISDDSCRLYLHSDATGTYKIYIATRPS